MKNKFLPIFSIVLALLLFTSCSKQNSNAEPVANKAMQLLDTFIIGRAYGDNSKRALDLAFERLKQIDSTMSRYNFESDIYKINENAGKKAVIVSPSTYFVIETAIHYANITNGTFNPVIGKVIDLWGIGTDHAKVPSKEELNMLLPHLDYDQLELDKHNSAVLLTSDKVSLDLGAIAKGYAADEMKRILQEQGITSASLNLGGNVLVIGSKPNGDSWTIGIQNPLESERGKLAATIKVKDTSLVTSGSYERYFEYEGKKYHHIIDPATGYPAENGIISSTIITPNSIDADALSTSVYILGKEKGLALIESLPNVEAVIITEDLHVYTTSGVTSDMLTIHSEEFIYEKS